MALITALSGCAASKNAVHRIDYSGQKLFYCVEIPEGHRVQGRTEYGSIHGTTPPDSYRAGEEVVLYFFMIATDTNYTFLLDGEPINPDYSHDKGYIIRFIMPDHDVRLECVQRNLMVREQVPE